MVTMMEFQSYTPVLPSVATSAQNSSIPDGCAPVKFSDMEFLPWNNPYNLVSKQVEIDSRKVRFVMLQILFLIGAPANVINMAVFFKQGLKDRVNLALFSLSLADEIFLLASMLLYSEEFYVDWVGDMSAGPIIVFMVNHNLGGLLGSCFVSFVLSAIIACERCYCVIRPLKYQTLMTTRTMTFIIVVVYIVVVGLNFVAVFRYHFVCIYNLDTNTASTILSHSEFYLHHKDLIDYVDNIFFGAGLPVVITIVVITATAITTVKLRHVAAWRSETSSSISPREIALTKMLIGTSVLLVVCVFPSCLFRVACLFLPDVNSGGRQQNFYLSCLWITQIFLFVNSSFNMVVYYVMGSRYRETFSALWKRKGESTTKKIEH